jgi:hypothetical protein
VIFPARVRVIAAIATALLLGGGLAAAPAGAAGADAVAVAGTARPVAINATVVRLRIEGATHTIFEGSLLTTGHTVTTAAGGTHHCDGTNNGVNPAPGPTATGALDDAARLVGFSWDGIFQPQFDDYFVTRIAASAQTDTQFWGILRNYEFTPVGGCQQRVHLGDQVLWAFDAFNAAHFLKLAGPATIRAGRPFTVLVTDGRTGEPISGATVGGQTTGTDGTATLTLSARGPHRLKAERSDSIRSNAIHVLVR